MARLSPESYRDRHPGFYKLVRKTNYFNGIDKIPDETIFQPAKKTLNTTNSIFVLPKNFIMNPFRKENHFFSTLAFAE